MQIGDTVIVFIKLEELKASEFGGTFTISPAPGVEAGGKKAQINDYLFVVKDGSGRVMPYHTWEKVTEQAASVITDVSGNIVNNVSVVYSISSSIENEQKSAEKQKKQKKFLTYIKTVATRIKAIFFH